MNLNNPKFTIRRKLLQEVIRQCENGSNNLLDEVFYILTHPFDEHDDVMNISSLKDDYFYNKNIDEEIVLSCSS